MHFYRVGYYDSLLHTSETIVFTFFVLKSTRKGFSLSLLFVQREGTFLSVYVTSQPWLWIQILSVKHHALVKMVSAAYTISNLLRVFVYNIGDDSYPHKSLCHKKRFDKGSKAPDEKNRRDIIKRAMRGSRSFRWWWMNAAKVRVFWILERRHFMHCACSDYTHSQDNWKVSKALRTTSHDSELSVVYKLFRTFNSC